MPEHFLNMLYHFNDSCFFQIPEVNYMSTNMSWISIYSNSNMNMKNEFAMLYKIMDQIRLEQQHMFI